MQSIVRDRLILFLLILRAIKAALLMLYIHSYQLIGSFSKFVIKIIYSGLGDASIRHTILMLSFLIAGFYTKSMITVM